MIGAFMLYSAAAVALLGFAALAGSRSASRSVKSTAFAAAATLSLALLWVAPHPVFEELCRADTASEEPARGPRLIVTPHQPRVVRVLDSGH